MAKTFKYWQDEIKIGMYYQNELYTQIKSYSPNHRLQAYDDACQLSNNNIDVCITASEQGYLLWQNLKTHSNKLDQDAAELETVMH